jgi:TolB-like protein
VLTISFSLLAACSQTPDVSNDGLNPMTGSSALGNVELHTFHLANELFVNVRPNRQQRYAVVGFVPIDTMVHDDMEQHPLMLLGHQLEQGMMTEATRRGLTTQDFKVSRDIIISDLSDRVLTRDIDKLTGLESVDFYITGTILPQQEGAIVNARVINARSRDVVAAATRFFPSELFWHREQVTTRDGHIYRKSAQR